MAIQAKPYNPADKLQRSIFAGNPSVFSAEDVNRQFDVIVDAQRRMSQMLGPIRAGFTVTLNSAVDTIAGANVDVALNITVAGTSRYCYFKGIRFDVPAITFNTTLTGPAQAFAAYIYLIAEKATVTFAQDPAMSGLSSAEFPTQLPSSDSVLYRNERLLLSVNTPAYVAANNLTSGEELICMIASVVETSRTHATTGVITQARSIRYNCSSIQEIVNLFPFVSTTGVNVIYSGNSAFVDVINHIEDYLHRKMSEHGYKFFVHDTSLAYLLSEDPNNAKLNRVNIYQKQNRFAQAAAQGSLSSGLWIPDDSGNAYEFSTANQSISLIRKMGNGTTLKVFNNSGGTLTINLNQTGSSNDLPVRCQSFISNVNGGSTVFTLVSGSTIELTQITNVWYLTNYTDTAVSIPELPIRSIIMWNGSVFTNFTGSGTGIPGSEMAKWAVCNGGTHNSVLSPDLRGRFIVGAIAGVPTAPGVVLPLGIDNAQLYPSTGGGLNPPNYAIGPGLIGSGIGQGEPYHKLIANEIAGHTHALWSDNGTTYGSQPRIASNQAYASGGTQVNVNGTVVANTGDTSHNNLPPYYGIVFLIKIS